MISLLDFILRRPKWYRFHKDKNLYTKGCYCPDALDKPDEPDYGHPLTCGALITASKVDSLEKQGYAQVKSYPWQGHSVYVNWNTGRQLHRYHTYGR